MQILKNFIVFFILIINLSCQSEDKIIISKINEIKLQIDDKDVLKNPFRFYFNGGVVNFDNEDFIYYINKKKSNILLYSILNNKTIEIKVSFSFLSRYKDNYISIVGKKNTLFLLIHPNLILKINKKGEVIEKINTSNFVTSIKNPEINNFSQQPAKWNKDILYTNIVFNTNTYLDYYNIDKINEETVKKIQVDFPLIAKILFDEKKITYFSYMPEYLTNYMALTSNFFVIIGDTVIVSFNKSDTLYLYKNDSLLGKENVSSEFINKFQPFENSDLTNFSYNRKYAITEPNYISLLNDRKNKLFYRVVKHRATYLNNSDLIREVSNSNWSLMVIDYDFDIIEEKYFQYQNEKFLVYAYSGGFITLKTLEDELAFNVYSVIKR